jgi:hypothetical protein
MMLRSPQLDAGIIGCWAQLVGWHEREPLLPNERGAEADGRGWGAGAWG